MTQEEFGRYWGMAKSVLREKLGAYELQGLVMAADHVVDEHGHLAILVGKAGDFAGRFLVKKERGTKVLDARWCSEDGDWYAWRMALAAGQDEWKELLTIVRKVVAAPNATSLEALGARRVGSTSP